MGHNVLTRCSVMRWFALSLPVMAIFSCACQAARVNLPNNDLDSLVYLADHIVEGEVVRDYEVQVQWKHLIEVKVTATYAGGLKAGQIVLVDVGSYTVPPSDFENAHEIVAGEMLFLFLKRVADLPRKLKEKQVFAPAGSGMTFVVNDKIWDYYRLWHPGIDSGEGKLIETADDLRQSIKQSIPKVAAWRLEFKAPARKKDIPRLLELLEARSHVRGRDWDGDDIIAQIVSVRLATLHDSPSLAKAMSINAGNPDVLAKGFGTPEGREFLLTSICDQKLPLERRREFVVALQGAGGIYDGTLTDIEPHSYFNRGKPGPKNSSYITRLAQLAAPGSLGDDLTNDVLKGLPHLAISGSGAPEVKADMNDACEVLVQLYNEESTSGKTQRLIREFMRMMGKETFEHLWGEVR
jgi:hypothetical protein